MIWRGAAFSEADRVSESFWRSLHYFSLYRLCVAGMFVLASLPFGWALSLGTEHSGLFQIAGFSYLILALFFLAVVPRLGLGFDLLLTIEVAIDVVALTVMMHASGGTRSGIGYMLMVVLAGAGLVGQGRLTLFYAALATLAVLFEQTYRLLQGAAEFAEFVQTGSISLGFFGTAITASLLARRAVAQEQLAERRGDELADQLRINQAVIRDMQDGVLVVDGDGHVRQYNPQAVTLLAIRQPSESTLLSFSPTLAERYPRWRKQTDEVSEALRIPATGRLIRARYIPAAESGRALIYLEDLERVQARTQQIKLAALGRLTANMAHEIRNPLSAISHAAELLAEGGAPETQARLTRIIGDNTQRLNRLVAEVLELGRRDRAKPDTIRLAGFIDTFIDDLALREPKVHDAVTADVAPETLTCFDRGHLGRVLSNLVGNAIRYASGGRGCIRIRSARSVEAGPVEIHVIDDGPGIDDSLRGQVFEPFFTTHSHGTGLGLYIARELCEANGATLSLLENSPGAHFCISARGDPCPHEMSDEAEATLPAAS